MSEKFSDEVLMRFADGELDPGDMAVIEQAMETNDELVARVAMFIETKAAAQAALKPLLDEPVPDALKAAVEGMVAAKRAGNTVADAVSSTVVPFAAREKVSKHAARRWMLPLAASITAVIGGLAGYWLAEGAGRPDPGGLSIAGVVDAELGEALAQTPSGQQALLASGMRLRPIATFRDAAEQTCREFELDVPGGSTFVSVACHGGLDWRVSFLVASPASSEGYAPASSLEALDAYLSAIEVGEPLSDEEERQALAEIGQ